MAYSAEGRNTGKHGEATRSAPAPPEADDLMKRLADLEMDREKYRTLFSQANEAVFLAELDDDGKGRARKFVEVNDTACAWLGYAPDEFYGMVPQDLVAPDDRPLLAAYRKTLADEQWITAEVGLLSRSGRVVPVEMSARAFLMGGKLMGLFIARDLSRATAFRSALAEAVERWRSMTDNCPDHILIVGEDGVIEFCNRGVLGLSRENLVGMRFFDHVPVSYRAFAEDSVKKLFQDGKNQFHEIEFVQSPERSFIFLAHLSPVTVGGRVKSAAIRLVDVSERKAMERSLMENEARYRNFVESFIGIAYEFDPALDRPSFFRGAVEAVTGYTEDDFLSGRIRWADLVHPLDRPKRGEIEPGKLLRETEYRIISRAGKTVHVTESARRMPGIPGGLNYGVIYDITGRKQKEDLIERRERELSESNASLTEMNTTLGILLKRRETDRADMERNVSENLGRVVMPLLAKLKTSGLSTVQLNYLDAMEKGIDQVVSGFGRTLSSHKFRLTPTEVQVAALVKEGHTTKDIAQMLNMSRSTVDTHRNNIRNKLEIKKQGVNLRAYLTSLE